MTALNWWRTLEATDTWGCVNPNMGIRELLVKNARRHGMMEQDEEQSLGSDGSEREEDGMSALSGSWVSDESVLLSVELVDLDNKSIVE